MCFRCAASANTRSTWQAKELEKRAEEEAKRKAKELSGTLAAEKTAQKSLENMDSSKLPPVENLEPGCGVDKPWRLSGDARVADWTKGTDVSVALAQFGAEYKGGAGFRQDQRASATMTTKGAVEATEEIMMQALNKATESKVRPVDLTPMGAAGTKFMSNTFFFGIGREHKEVFFHPGHSAQVGF